MQARGLLVWVSASAHGRAPGKGSMLVTSSVLGSGHHQPHAVDKETVFLIL